MTTTATLIARPATSAVLAALALCSAACGAQSAAAPASPPASPAATATAPVAEPSAPAAEPSEPSAAPAGSFLDGTRLVDVRLYTGEYLVPTVEGGLGAVSETSRSELPSSWVFTPASPGAAQHLVVTESTTDGQPSCLRAVDPDSVALATCDPGDPAQLMSVVTLDSAEQVGITSSFGQVVSTTESELVVVDDPRGPNGAFTLVERGLSTQS